jgi:uncharacterized membrane protein
MVTNYVWVALLTLLPGLELRLSILYGLSQGLDPLAVFVIAVVVNTLLGPVILVLLNTILPYVLKISFLNKVYQFFVLRTRDKYHPTIKKYGSIGLVLFIALPLPGSGSWTGALAAFLLGVDYKKFAVINFVGVLIAGIIVTLAGLGILSLL